MCKRRQADGRMDLLRRHHPLPRGVGWPRHSPPAVLGWVPVLPQAPRCDHQSRVHGKDRLPILRIYYLKKKQKTPAMLPGACLIAQLVKNLPAMQETSVRFLGWEDSLEEGTATHSSVLAWRIPWTQSMGSQRSDTTERLSLSLSYATYQSGRIGNC